MPEKPKKKPYIDAELRWRAFVDKYIELNFNAIRAFKECGHYTVGSDRAAQSGSSRLLGKPEVQEYLRQAIEARNERTSVTRDKVIRELARIGFFDLTSVSEWDDDGLTLLPSDQISEDDSAAMSEVHIEEHEYGNEEDGIRRNIKKRVKAHDKLGALKELAKHVDLYGDRARGDAFVAEIGQGLSRLMNYTPSTQDDDDEERSC